MPEHFLYVGDGNPNCWYAIRAMMQTKHSLTVTPHPERAKSLIEEGGTRYSAVLIDLDGTTGLARSMNGKEFAAWVIDRGLKVGLLTNKPQVEAAASVEKLGATVFNKQDNLSYPLMFERLVTNGWDA